MTLVATSKNRSLLPGLWDEFFNDPLYKRMGLFPEGATLSIIPDANIIENEDNFQIELAAPGLQRKDFNVEVADGNVSISAEKEEEKEENRKNFRRREFSFSSFNRSFALPDNVVADEIDAKYTDGVLRVTIPKKEIKAAQPAKQIKVE